VQHERVCIRTKLGNDEWDPLSHQPGDEGNVAGEAIELGDDDRAFAGLAGCQRRSELWSPFQGVGALAGLDLRELGDQRVALGLGEPGDCCALGLDAEPRAALPGGGDPVVGNGMLHSDKNPPLPYRQHTTVCRLYVA
jgi:hypothetical protein